MNSTTAQKVTAEEVLRAARTKISKDGNTVGTYGSARGSVCALGAVAYAQLVTRYPAGPGKPTGGLGAPYHDNNGVDDATRALYNALPQFAKLKTLPKYGSLQAMESQIIKYNDGRILPDGSIKATKSRRKHNRTITKWFDRALASVRSN